VHFFFSTKIYGDDVINQSQIWCKLRFTLSNTCAIISFYTICLAAIDQFLSTHHLFYFRQTYSMKLAQYSTLILVSFAIIHGCLFDLGFGVQPFIGCVLVYSIAYNYSIYFLYPILIGCTPNTIASVYGILAYRSVRR